MVERPPLLAVLLAFLLAGACRGAVRKPSVQELWQRSAPLDGKIIAVASIDDQVHHLMHVGNDSVVATIILGDDKGWKPSTHRVPGHMEEMCAMERSNQLALVDRAGSTIWLLDLETGLGTVLACGPQHEGDDCPGDNRLLPGAPVSISCQERPNNECLVAAYVGAPLGEYAIRYACIGAVPDGRKGRFSQWKVRSLVWLVPAGLLCLVLGVLVQHYCNILQSAADDGFARLQAQPESEAVSPTIVMHEQEIGPYSRQGYLRPPDQDNMSDNSSTRPLLGPD